MFISNCPIYLLSIIYVTWAEGVCAFSVLATHIPNYIHTVQTLNFGYHTIIIFELKYLNIYIFIHVYRYIHGLVLTIIDTAFS